MPSIDIFQDPAFDVIRLTKLINAVPRIPTKLGDLGLFSEEGIPGTQVSIQADKTGLHLVPARARGAPPEPVSARQGKRVNVQTTHLPQRSSVMADEILNLKTFGMPDGIGNDVASITALVNKRFLAMRQNNDLTMEWQRIGAIKGIVLDYDGVTPILDLYDTFGVTQQKFAMHLDDTATKVRQKSVQVRRLVESKLGGLGYTSLRAIAGPDFMDALTGHASVEAAFNFPNTGDFLRRDVTAGNGTFEFGGITYDEYQGGIVIGSNDATGVTPSINFVEPNCAYVYPVGVPELFKTFFAPGDYTDAVGTNGLPYYANQEPMSMKKGVVLEGQSNPLNICTRPDVIIKLYLGSSTS